VPLSATAVDSPALSLEPATVVLALLEPSVESVVLLTEVVCVTAVVLPVVSLLPSSSVLMMQAARSSAEIEARDKVFVMDQVS
jgi:hypothetical protein